MSLVKEGLQQMLHAKKKKKKTEKVHNIGEKKYNDSKSKISLITSLNLIMMNEK
jgi:hypothetical protein